MVYTLDHYGIKMNRVDEIRKIVYIQPNITGQFLVKNSDCIFVFGDNIIHRGKKGAATLRDYPNTHGFVTKKFPNNDKESFYKPTEYKTKYIQELEKLKKKVIENPDKIYLITKLGFNLANRYHIFEQVIEPDIKKSLEVYNNVIFLW